MFKKRFGFISRHEKNEFDYLKSLRNYVLLNDESIVRRYEESFSEIIGSGTSVSFASARMAFYALMKVLGIREGDEVILPAFTCAVMANAIKMLGAIPIFVDIERETFGSTAKTIEHAITANTRLIIAQHTFGIPCDIKEIKHLCEKLNIFLLEDCALTLSSKIDGIICGNFGDAAIFSTDRSKPLNTMIGGFLYTKDEVLAKKILKYRDTLEELSNTHKLNLYGEMMFEHYALHPRLYFFYRYAHLIRARLLKKLIFFIDDFGLNLGSKRYPYPAKLPTFIAIFGIFKLRMWPNTLLYRLQFSQTVFKILSESGIEVPNVYFDPRKYVAPLRIAFTADSVSYKVSSMLSIVDSDWVWFRQPIIASEVALEEFNYVSGSSPVAESICNSIGNIPCNLNSSDGKKFLNKLKQMGS